MLRSIRSRSCNYCASQYHEQVPTEMFYQAWRNSRGEANKLEDPLWPAAESGLSRISTSGAGRIGIARIVLPDHARYGHVSVDAPACARLVQGEVCSAPGICQWAGSEFDAGDIHILEISGRGSQLSTLVDASHTGIFMAWRAERHRVRRSDGGRVVLTGFRAG